MQIIIYLGDKRVNRLLLLLIAVVELFNDDCVFILVKLIWFSLIIRSCWVCWFEGLSWLLSIFLIILLFTVFSTSTYLK